MEMQRICTRKSRPHWDTAYRKHWTPGSHHLHHLVQWGDRCIQSKKDHHHGLSNKRKNGLELFNLWSISYNIHLFTSHIIRNIIMFKIDPVWVIVWLDHAAILWYLTKMLIATIDSDHHHSFITNIFDIHNFPSHVSRFIISMRIVHWGWEPTHILLPSCAIQPNINF